ncbi:glycine--tRNA ligase subunit beta [Buchnera aphidicola (Astegopteryx bambusae)]|uniref:glycine--tRNA ligase subunit beta n=1 Tax=Buchnera aphidicola TaxID=9 RepID=UPI0031B81856
MKKIFLLEIITEELPPKHLKDIIISFKKNILHQIKNKFLKYKKVEWYLTSRRLIIEIINIHYQDKYINNYIKTNLKNKNITKKKIIKNKIYSDFKEIILKSIKKIHIRKFMHWSNSKIKFIRPIRNVLCLLDKKIININILGVKSTNYTLSNLFIKNNKKIHVTSIHEYKKKIKKYGKVIINFEDRKNIILKKIEKKIKRINGTLKKNTEFLEEISCMTEWPEIYIAKFNKKFLKIYKKLIIHIIEKVQKCFLIYSTKKKITKYFVIVSNVRSKNPKRIISEYENVINEKLKDINFFLKLDKKKKLIENLKKLKKYIFHNKLGTLFDKTVRIKKISYWIAKQIKIKNTHIKKAALLSKCDLLTNMVFEFPEMQGYIGMKYAIIQGENKVVAESIKEQYYPVSYNSKIPKNKISCIISISDKIDTIIGLFSIGKNPNSKNDPFHIRKNSIGIIRILLEKKIEINIIELIKISLSMYIEEKNKKKKIENKIIKYFKKRILSLLKKYNFKKNIILSSIKIFKIIPIKIYKNVLEVSKYDKIQNIKNSYKRIKNIIKNRNIKKLKTNYKIIKKNQIEKKLYLLTKDFKKNIKKMLENYNYKNIFKNINIICKVLNLFFEKVFINDKNEIVRNNRILLLHEIKNQFNRIIKIKYIL